MSDAALARRGSGLAWRIPAWIVLTLASVVVANVWSQHVIGGGHFPFQGAGLLFSAAWGLVLAGLLGLLGHRTSWLGKILIVLGGGAAPVIVLVLVLFVGCFVGTALGMHGVCI